MPSVPNKDIDEQHRPRSDFPQHGVWSESTLHRIYSILHLMKQIKYLFKPYEKRTLIACAKIKSINQSVTFCFFFKFDKEERLLNIPVYLVDVYFSAKIKHFPNELRMKFYLPLNSKFKQLFSSSVYQSIKFSQLLMKMPTSVDIFILEKISWPAGLSMKKLYNLEARSPVVVCYEWLYC